MSDHPLEVRPIWQKSAACRGMAAHDSDMFFPKSNSLELWDRAAAICATCKVQAECLEAGMDEPHGIWGGTRPFDRRKLRRATRQAEKNRGGWLTAEEIAEALKMPHSTVRTRISTLQAEGKLTPWVMVVKNHRVNMWPPETLAMVVSFRDRRTA